MTNRAENRHGIDVNDSEDKNIELKDGSERVKEPVLEVGIGLLLVLLLQADDGLRRDNSFLLAFNLVRQGDGYYRGRKTARKTCVVKRTVLICMSRYRVPVDDISHDALLIRAYGPPGDCCRRCGRPLSSSRPHPTSSCDHAYTNRKGSS